MSSALNSLIVPMAIGLSFALFRRILPAVIPEGENLLTDEERRHYHRREA